MDPMETAIRKLQGAMQMHYGAEFLNKWSGFQPHELARIWVHKFAAQRIHPTVVEALCGRIVWDHPPTLPVLIEAAEHLQEQLHQEHKARQAFAALPPPSEVAAPDSAGRQAFLAELKRWEQGHVA